MPAGLTRPRRILTPLLTCALVGLGLAVSQPASAVVTPGLTAVTFNYTGAIQTWSVPTGVESVYVQMAGGAGGSAATGGGAAGPVTTSSTVSATLTIPSGVSALDVTVGGQGQNGQLGGAGGWPNGGTGGTGLTTDDVGAGGGGSSDIRPSGTPFTSALIVVGGSGGGGSGNDGNVNGAGYGGSGGFVSADWGQTGGGDDGGPGGQGGNIAGGQGGNGTAPTISGNNGGGGGGGGGWLGGSGGGGGTADSISLRTGGGGGGGGGIGSQVTEYVAGASQVSEGAQAFATLSYLAMTVSTVPTLTVGTYASWDYDAGANAIYALTSGTLPPGLTFDGINGELGGVPTQTGSYTFTISASTYPDGVNAVTTSSTMTLNVFTGGPANVTATAAAPIGTTTATMNGTILAGATPVTDVACVYSTTNPGGGAITGTSVAATPSTVEPLPTVIATNVSCPTTGLLSNQQYYYQVVGTQGGSTVRSGTATFTTGSALASPTTSAATSVASTTATGNGTLTATQNVTSIVCKVATTPSGVATSATTFTASPASTSGNQSNRPLTCTMTGLTPNTAYYYAFFATDTSGTAASPTIESFLTKVSPPQLGAIASGTVTSSSAAITGTVTPTNETVTAVFCRFVVKPGNPALGTAVAADPFQISRTPTPRSVTCTLTGLAASTTYLVRMEATDRDGTAAAPNIVQVTTSASGGGGGGGGGSTPAPDPTPTPTPAPATPTQPTPEPSALPTPSLQPQFERVLPGLAVAVDPASGSVRRTKPIRPGDSEESAPLVIIRRGVPTSIVVRDLLPNRPLQVRVRAASGAAWRELPAARASRTGTAALSPLVVSRTSPFVIRLTQAGESPSYIEMKVRPVGR